MHDIADIIFLLNSVNFEVLVSVFEKMVWAEKWSGECRTCRTTCAGLALKGCMALNTKKLD